MKNTTKIICFLGCSLLMDTTFAIASQEPVNGGQKRKRWSQQEDQLLKNAVEQHGKQWALIAQEIPGRNNKACQNRYDNHLDPSKQKINGPWTPEEDKLLAGKVTELGTKWKEIAAFFPERTPNDIKNRWYRHLSKEIDQEANPNPGQKKIHWTPPEDLLLRELLEQQPGRKNWHPIASRFPNRSAKQCGERWNYIKSQPKPTILPQQQIPAMMPPVHRNNERWSQQEDQLLRNAVVQYGTKNWQFIAKQVFGRTARQCMERWINSLDPSIGKGPWSFEEDQTLLNKVRELGTQWIQIAKFLPGWTELDIKNRWSRYFSKEASQQLNPPALVPQPQPLVVTISYQLQPNPKLPSILTLLQIIDPYPSQTNQ
jgi:myb proto-oncogene protein